MITRSREDIRKIEQCAIQKYGIPEIVLLENAGRSAADFILSKKSGGRVTICCGKGNNAGDGFVVARHLDNHGVPVRILLFAEPEDLQGSALVNYRVCLKSGIFILYACQQHSVHAIKGYLDSSALIVDALFGTGLRGEPDQFISRLSTK